MMKKLSIITLFAILLLIQLSFAGWMEISGMAIVTSAALLALIYMIGVGFNINELTFLAKEEFYQLIITVLMVGLLVSASSFFDAILEASGGTYASATNVVDSVTGNLTTIFNNIKSQADMVSVEASKSVFCAFIGVSANIAACGAYRSLMPIYSLSYQVLAIGLMEVSSLKTLLTIGKEYAFTLFLPFGIFLRTFKFTRGAGGFLIAVGVAFYFVLPLTIVAFDLLASKAKHNIGYGQPVPLSGVGECKMWNSEAADDNENVKNVINILDDLNTKSMNYLYVVLINASLGTIIPIGVAVISIRTFSALAGADVDVSALMRLA